MKRLFALVLVVSMLFINAMPALAAEPATGPIVVAPVTLDEVRPDDGSAPDLLIEKVARGTSKPTTLWDLGTDLYPWAIEGLRSTIYSSYLFKPNPDPDMYDLRVETYLDRDYTQGPTTYVVNLYTKSGTWVYTSTVNTGGWYYITYDNLDSNTQYYVSWVYAGGQSQTLSGSGYILWPSPY